MVAKKNLQTQPRYAFWIISMFVILFFNIAPFKKALFNMMFLQFENPIYYSVLFGSIALLAIAISLYFNKLTSLNDPILHIVVWLIPLSMFLSSLSPVSHSLAVNGVYIYLFLAGMFVLARYLTADKLGHSILYYSLIGSSYMIVIFGFMNWFGDASFFGLFNYSTIPDQFVQVYKDAVQVDSNGPRMASVFQYANTYAAYLTGVLFLTLYTMVTSTRRSILIISSLLLVPILLSMLLTLSRGGWAAALVSYLIILFFIQIHKQLLMLLYSFLGAVMTIVIFDQINQSGNELRESFSASSYSLAWIILIGASALITLITLAIHKYSYSYIRNKFIPFSTKRWATLIVPILLLMFGVLAGYLLLQDTPINRALPDNLEQRIDNINLNQHSVLERGTFYSDAWKLYKDYPILGAGHGAWATLYEQYQNNPYTSRLAHSFIMQHLVETGTVGTIIFLAFLALVLFQFVLRLRIHNRADGSEVVDPRLPYFLFAFPILVHSMIDFDMSFIYITAILFLCFGAMTVDEIPLFNLTKPSFIGKWQRIYPISLIVLSFIMLIGSFQLIRANTQYTKLVSGAQAAPSMQYIIDSFDHILRIRDDNPTFTFSKSELYSQLYSQSNDIQYYNDNLELINTSLQAEPYNAELIKRKLELLFLGNKINEAYALTNESLIMFPWNIAYYENNLQLSVQLIAQEIQTRQYVHAGQYIQTSISTYQKLNKQIEHLGTLPEGQLQGQSFLTTPTIELNAAKAYYLGKDYKTAEAILKPLVSIDKLSDKTYREIARWYLVSLLKQDQDDADIYMQLTSSDTNENILIQELLTIDIP
jgi:hypothetical protein